MSQFDFIRTYVNAVCPDPRTACFYARRALEMAVVWIYKHDPAVKLPYQEQLSALIHDPTFKQTVGPALFAKARLIEDLGSLAAHSPKPLQEKDSLRAGAGPLSLPLLDGAHVLVGSGGADAERDERRYRACAGVAGFCVRELDVPGKEIPGFLAALAGRRRGMRRRARAAADAPLAQLSAGSGATLPHPQLPNPRLHLIDHVLRRRRAGRAAARAHPLTKSLAGVKRVNLVRTTEK